MTETELASLEALAKAATPGTKPYEHRRCWNCDGHGVVAHYDTDWFLIPDECKTCGGSGYVIQYRESGVLAKYPGGPLLGREKM